MASRRPNLNPDELTNLIHGKDADKFPPILSLDDLATLLNVSRKTLDGWKSKGRLEGTYRKRGKRVFVLRDRAIKQLLDGPDW